QQTQAAIEHELFNGEFFIQKPEPGREGALGTYESCHIDQVHGQSWAWQVGLPRVLDREKTLSSLRALYTYNFTQDVGPFRQRNQAGRPYALAGDGGLIMATNPKGLKDAFGNVRDWQYGYFNECMSGFEHQAASHMIAEGLVTEGLAVTRAIHDRYHARKRNPFNEVECSDHYARAMASYGSFISLCGFSYHGPSGQLALDPRLPGDFKVPFTTAEGWGSIEQKGKRVTVTLQWGVLRLTTLTVRGKTTNFEPPLFLGARQRGAAVGTRASRATVPWRISLVC
uniref:GH116 family glycosyl hydrolase n=1 Tax=Armatimonas sp. TaxID=1872638 RepID=UPI00286D59DF